MSHEDLLSRDFLADLASEDRDRLGQITINDFFAYSTGELSLEEAEPVRELLAVHPQCAQWMLELQRRAKADPPSQEEIEEEWRTFERQLGPGEMQASPRRRKWAQLAAMLVFGSLGTWLVFSSSEVPETSLPAEFQELSPDRGPVRGVAPVDLKGSKGGLFILKLLVPASIDLEQPVPSTARFELTLGEEAIEQGQLLLQDEGDYVLVITKDSLRPGEYGIRLLYPDEATTSPLAIYSFNWTPSP